MKTLDLNIPSIVTIPETLFDLKQLTYLALCDGLIEQISDSIVKLKSLTSLNLHNNKLTTFPITICKLPKLQELYWGGNNITEIPEQIGNMHSLRQLYIFNNQIRELPKSICKLKLKTLVICGNNFKHIPIGVIIRFGKLTYDFRYDNFFDWEPIGYIFCQNVSTRSLEYLQTVRELL